MLYDWKKLNEEENKPNYASLLDFIQTLPSHTVTEEDIIKAVAIEEKRIPVYSVTQYLTESAILITND